MISNNDPAYKMFVNEYTGKGDLKVHCLMLDETLPIEGARVIVNKRLGNDVYRIGEGLTDNSGIVEFKDLPCYALEKSLQPNTVPYAGIYYEITIDHPDFGTLFDRVAIFDDVKTVHRKEVYQMLSTEV